MNLNQIYLFRDQVVHSVNLHSINKEKKIADEKLQKKKGISGMYSAILFSKIGFSVHIAGKKKKEKEVYFRWRI